MSHLEVHEAALGVMLGQVVGSWVPVRLCVPLHNPELLRSRQGHLGDRTHV